MGLKPQTRLKARATGSPFLRTVTAAGSGTRTLDSSQGREGDTAFKGRPPCRCRSSWGPDRHA